MTQTTAAKGPAYPQVVVDSDAASIVEEVLSSLTVTATAGEPHPELRLTRLTIELGPDDSLDALLAELRRRIAEQNGGWLPSIGKDREASSPMVTGYSRIMSFTPTVVPVDAHGGHPRVVAVGGPSSAHGGIPKIMAIPPAIYSESPGADDVGYEILSTSPAISDDFHPPVDGGVRIGWIDTELADLEVAPGGDAADAWRAHSAFVRDLIRQVAPDAEEPVLRGVLKERGGRGDLWDVAVAMVDLVLHAKVDILLLPLATYTADGLPPLLLRRALEVISGRCLIIAAAGNQLVMDGWKRDRCRTTASWPAAFPQVRAVAARFDGPSHPLPQWVDAFTPSAYFEARFFTGMVRIEADTPATEFYGAATWAGTSFSAAHAAGLVAARMSATGLTATQAWDALVAEGEQLIVDQP